MSFNPFDEKNLTLDKTVLSLKKQAIGTYNKEQIHPFSKLWIILMNGTEFEAVWNKHHLSRTTPNNDLRREVGYLRALEQQQQKLISGLKPVNESILEHTIGYEQLAVELTAELAQRETDKNAKNALDFALLEDFDHLYRFSNLLLMDDKIKAENMLNKLTEIMPGRPTIAEHRHPFDNVKTWTNFPEAGLITKLNSNIITAAEQQTMNYYMNVAGFYQTETGKKMFSEIALIEEQHVTQYGCLIDPRQTPLEMLLMHEYTECYLYYSAYSQENDRILKSIWEQCLIQEIAHLKKASELLEKFEGGTYQKLFPKPEFPEVLRFSSNFEYIRKVLKNTITLTSFNEDYCEVNQLPKQNNFCFWQKEVVPNVNEVPSHTIMQTKINNDETDYRFMVKPYPVKELKDQTKDNTSIARPKCM